MWWYRHSRDDLPMITSDPNQPQNWFQNDDLHSPPWFAVCCSPVPLQYPAKPRAQPDSKHGSLMYQTSAAIEKTNTAAASRTNPPRPLGARPFFCSRGAMISSRTLCWIRLYIGESRGLGKDSSGHKFTSVSTLGKLFSVFATNSGRTWWDSNKIVASLPTASANSCAPPGCDLAKSVMSYTWPRICVYWRSGLRPLPSAAGPAAEALPPLPIASVPRA
mmetsp:Transcript_11943/g.39676  ORF Transcript_11943/g.39676 Transcript_11943/m.39676 type:complete len:219 (+) Transcript_11943:908-1564(+)